MLIIGFPGVIGAIDCTHLRLIAPTNNPEDYINRKGNHSINVQVGLCSALFKTEICKTLFITDMVKEY